MSIQSNKRPMAVFSVLIAAALALASCTPAQPAQPPPGPTTGPENPSSGASSNPTAMPPTSAPASTEVKNPNTLIEATIGGPDLLALASSIRFMVTGGVLLLAVTLDAYTRARRELMGNS